MMVLGGYHNLTEGGLADTPLAGDAAGGADDRAARAAR